MSTEKIAFHYRLNKLRFVSQKRTAPLSLRLSPELNARLKECSERLKVKKHALAQDAIEAAVEAIEKNGFKLVVPIQFEVISVPVGRLVKYPPHREERIVVEDKSSSQKTAEAFVKEEGERLGNPSSQKK